MITWPKESFDKAFTFEEIQIRDHGEKLFLYSFDGGLLVYTFFIDESNHRITIWGVAKNGAPESIIHIRASLETSPKQAFTF